MFGVILLVGRRQARIQELVKEGGTSQNFLLGLLKCRFPYL